MERVGANPALPPTLRDILLARLEALSVPAQAVVRAAAAGGSHVAHALLAAVVPVPEAELLAALREAVTQHVLVAAEDAYAFRHALLQEAAYGELLPGERRRLHAAYAQALTERPELSSETSAYAEVAHHWFSARDLACALTAAVAAGEAAEARYGFAEARRHFERALEAWDGVPDASGRVGMGRAEVIQRAAEAAFLAGDHAGAASLVSRALGLVHAAEEPLRAGLLQERLGRYLWAAGESEAALVAYERAAGLVPAHPASGGRARIMAAQGQALMLLTRYRESSSRCREAIAVARGCGERAVEGHARNTLGFDLGCLGQAEAGIAELRLARVIAQEVENLDDLARALLNLAELLAGPADRLDEALAAATEGIEIVNQLGLDRDYGVSLRASAASALHGLGRWAEAERLLVEGVDLDPLGMAAIDLHLGLARVMVGTGRFKEARARLEAARRLCTGAVDPQVHAPLWAATAELALWEARPEEARRAAAEGLRHLDHTDDVFFTALLLSLRLRAEADRAETIRAGHAAGDVEEASAVGRGLLDRARALVAGRSSPVAAGHARVCQAELSRLEGRPDPDAWAAAALSWERLGRPYPAAQARWRQGESMLRSPGATGEPGPVLGGAHVVAVQLGARPLGHALQELARRHGLELERPPTTNAAPGR